MHRHKSVLAVLRRQRGRLGRIVVAWFALASFTVAGAPCFAMANAKADAGEHAAETHAHADDGHAMGHGDGSPAAGHDHGSTHKEPAHCPHCPLSAATPNHAPPSNHSFCSAFDEGADQTSFTPASFAKHVLLAPMLDAPRPLLFRPPPRSSPRAKCVQRSAIAVNLRNCVLLI
jgi:hypothetical protein